MILKMAPPVRGYSPRLPTHREHRRAFSAQSILAGRRLDNGEVRNEEGASRARLDITSRFVRMAVGPLRSVPNAAILDILWRRCDECRCGGEPR